MIPGRPRKECAFSRLASRSGFSFCGKVSRSTETCRRFSLGSQPFSDKFLYVFDAGSTPMRLIASALIILWLIYALGWENRVISVAVQRVRRPGKCGRNLKSLGSFLIHLASSNRRPPSNWWGTLAELRGIHIFRSLLNTSFTLWQNALGNRLHIIESASSSADIEIYFARRHHGDKEVWWILENKKNKYLQAFDGEGGLVAHSGLPARGYLHLDADEKWTFDGESNKLDLRYVGTSRCFLKRSGFR